MSWWPLLLALVGVGSVLSSLFKGRTFLTTLRDPNTAIYRDHQPGLFWGVVGVQFVAVAILIAVAFIV